MLLLRSQLPLDALIRSLGPAAWFRQGVGITVTGAGVSMWADAADSDNSLVLSGVAGNYASTPDSAAISISGDLEIVARAALDDWTPSAVQGFWGSLNVAATTGFQLRVVATTGRLLLGWGDGTTFVTASSTVAPTVSNGSYLWVKGTLDVDNGSGGYTVRFYTAADQNGEPSSWTQLGDAVVGGSTTSIANGDGVGTVGFLAVTGTYTTGRIKRVIVRSGIDGTTVFDANFAAQAKGTTSFTESSSNAATVTVNQSGALPAHIGSQKDLLQGTDAARPALQGDGTILFNGTSHYLKTNAFTLNQPEWVLWVGKQVSWTSLDILLDGDSVNTMLCYQHSSTPRFSISSDNAVNVVGTNANLAVGSVGVLSLVFNGASSSTRVNNTAAVTGNAGSNAAGGLTLGARANGLTNANISTSELIVFPFAPSTALEARLIAGLMARHGVA